jgi:uncharacterized protein
VPDDALIRIPDRLFDIHTHLLSDSALNGEFLAFAREYAVRFGVSSLGPDGAVIARPTPDDFRRANDHTLELMAQLPDLAFGFCYVSPLHPDESVVEIHRCVCDGPMRGVKLWIAVPCSDPRTDAIAQEAAALGVPVLQHAWVRIGEKLDGESTPRDVAIFARRNPATTIIMAHMAFDWRIGVAAVADCPNVLVDTCGFDPELGSVEHAVAVLGAGRVLYGSDAPGRDVHGQLGKVLAARISENERRAILYGNAERLLRGGRTDG